MLMYDLYQQPLWIILGIVIILSWQLFWKGFGLWFSGKNKQKGWFIAILLLNTMGLLPIIYLIWFKPKEKKEYTNVQYENMSSIKSQKKNDKEVSKLIKSKKDEPIVIENKTVKKPIVGKKIVKKVVTKKPITNKAVSKNKVVKKKVATRRKSSGAPKIAKKKSTPKKKTTKKKTTKRKK